jgi:regulator of ribosome biosynthesis
VYQFIVIRIIMKKNGDDALLGKSQVSRFWRLATPFFSRNARYIHTRTQKDTQIRTHTIIMSEEEAATTTTAANNNRLRIETTLEATNAYAGPLDIDVGNLLVSETTSVLEREKFSLEHGVSYEERNENVRAHARDVLQRLVGDLFALPSESDVNGRFALLPPGTTKFPRSLPLPSLTKPKTKWEQFAEEKGIKKRKRSKMVFDEQQDEWKRRHGYDRANDSTKIAIVEAKLSSRAGETEDPFLKERKDKKARVEKNEMQRRRNLGEQVKTKGIEALPATLRLAIGNTNNNSNSNSKKGGGGSADRVGAKSLKSKQLVKDVQYKVATSTASVGKFNAPIPGDEKIKARGKRRSFASNTANTKSQEKAFVEKLIQREKMKKTSEGVDVGLAARKMQKEQEMEKREGKKQKLRGGGGGGGKKKK